MAKKHQLLKIAKNYVPYRGEVEPIDIRMLQAEYKRKKENLNNSNSKDLENNNKDNDYFEKSLAHSSLLIGKNKDFLSTIKKRNKTKFRFICFHGKRDLVLGYKKLIQYEQLQIEKINQLIDKYGIMKVSKRIELGICAIKNTNKRKQFSNFKTMQKTVKKIKENF